VARDQRENARSYSNEKPTTKSLVQDSYQKAGSPTSLVFAHKLFQKVWHIAKLIVMAILKSFLEIATNNWRSVKKSQII